ncbi:hypothetical protein [Agromyces mariniharenae]|uniref:DUF4386 family protein n=1 Tax=Agromyces mariniharenae TaxID=2604423 RepID=A0A5S4V957_9MICO|nr:hypothetical protein [Agromyces mariniharenae]TYL53861.1 hypothetical protein FYC51_09545 [Agromyces mariniharenae]
MSTSSASAPASGSESGSGPESAARDARWPERRLYRTAGLGGIIAVGAWLGQPVVVAVASAAAGDEFATMALLQERPYSGVIEAVIFLGMAVGLFAFVRASSRLVRRRTGPDELTWARVGEAFGYVGAAAWIGVASASLTPFTSVGLGLAETLPDATSQMAVLYANAFLITAFGLTGAIGLGGYAAFLATAGRRAGVIGWPVALIGFAATVALAVPFFVPFSAPWGAVGVLTFVLVAGGAFLLRSRRPAVE